MAGPLEGIRVIDLTQVVAGPTATMVLADMGADVIKVEPPGYGDMTRLGHFAKGGMNSAVANVNRGKRSIQIDVGADAGRELVLSLMATADVAIQNLRPGVVDRLGVGWDAARAVNPDIVYCSMSGYGTSGPYADRPVFDPIMQAITGYVATQVNPQIPFPDLVRNAVIDKAAGFNAVMAVLAALLARAGGAGGQHIEMNMLDTAVQFLWYDAALPDTMLDDDVTGGYRLSDLYQLTPCEDGHIVYFVITDDQYKGLFRALGRHDLVDHPVWGDMEGRRGRFEEMGAILAEEFSTWKVADLAPRMHAESVPCGEVNAMDELPTDPQIVHNGTFVEWDHPTGGRLRQPRFAPRFSATEPDFRASAPLLNEHADAILAELGLDEHERRALHDAGVVPDGPLG